MIITQDDCCKLIMRQTTPTEKKVGYSVKIVQTCEEDGLENDWCLTPEELKELINWLVKEAEKEL